MARAEVLMVGDYLYDIQAGRRAGTRHRPGDAQGTTCRSHLSDVAFASFEDLPEALLRWLGDWAGNRP